MPDDAAYITDTHYYGDGCDADHGVAIPDRDPDIWVTVKDGRALYWCINGVWRWRIVKDDGTVSVEGVGPP